MKAKAAKPAAQSATGQPESPAEATTPESAKAIASPAQPAKVRKAPLAKGASAPKQSADDPAVSLKAAGEKNKKSTASKSVKPKSRKPKLVRDSFTMPDAEYALLANIKQACLRAGFEVKKSELLRIGVNLVSALDTASLRTHRDALTPLKPGRPKASRAKDVATNG